MVSTMMVEEHITEPDLSDPLIRKATPLSISERMTKHSREEVSLDRSSKHEDAIMFRGRDK